MKKKKKRSMATPTQKQWIIDRIMESPESCARMKQVITDDLNNHLLKANPPDGQSIQGAENFLRLISVVEKIFQADKNADVKKILELSESVKKYGVLGSLGVDNN